MTSLFSTKRRKFRRRKQFARWQGAKFALIADAYDDTALSNRVKAIEDDYLKAEHKTALEGLISAEQQRAEGIEGGLRTDVNTILGDYLKAADKTELEGKITAEETRAKGVEESLQTQINTIMNNPDTEGVINSINEFTQYISDHGEIAEGFRTDIDKNKEDITAHAGRLDAVEADMESHVHSWNDLEDKPFYESEPITLEFTDVNPGTGDMANWYKVSDQILSRNTLVGATLNYTQGSSTYEYVVKNSDVIAESSDYPFLRVGSSLSSTSYDLVRIVSDPSSGFDVGVYFCKNTFRSVQSLTYTEIVQLDEKFIPSTIARTSVTDNLNNRIIELNSGINDCFNYVDEAKADAIQAAADDAAAKYEEKGVAYAKSETYNKEEVDAAVDAAVEAAKLESSNKDAVVLAESQAYADQAKADAIADAESKVNALAGNVYTKAETYTQAEVDALIAAAHTWGEF